MAYLTRFMIWFVFLCLTASGLTAETLHMGYFNLPPHQYTLIDKTKPQGASIVYFEEIAKAMGYTVTWIGPLPLPRLTQSLKMDKNLDGTVGFPKYDSFEIFLDYTSTPIYMGQPTFVVLEDNLLNRIDTIRDIDHYRIGLVKSASGKYTPLIDNNRDRLHIEELGGDTWIEQNIIKLLHGRLNALFDRQQYAIPFVAARLGYDRLIKTIPAPAPPTPMYIVFSKISKHGRPLVEKCNKALSIVPFDYDEHIKKEFEALKNN